MYWAQGSRILHTTVVASADRAPLKADEGGE